MAFARGDAIRASPDNFHGRRPEGAFDLTVNLGDDLFALKSVPYQVSFAVLDGQPLALPRFLGQHHWTRGFVQQVRDGEVEGITFEGVVGSSGEGHKLLWSKAKTQRWVDAVLSRYGEEAGTKIVES